MRLSKHQSGFTLLELLVSISIFAVLGLGSYQLLQTTITSNERVLQSVDEYSKLTLAFAIIQRDFTQHLPRQIRDEYGDPKPPMIFGEDDYVVEFSRTGWSNPAGRNRSTIQRVAYGIDYDEKTLTRYFWEVLDRAEDSEPRAQVLMTNVTDFRVTGFTPDDEFGEEEFSLDDDENDFSPVAVEVVVSTEALGDVQRVFQTVDLYVDDGSDAAFGNSSNDEDGESNDNNGGTTEQGDNES